jgi:threonine/homoserine/homoserine lactone efflux protein
MANLNSKTILGLLVLLIVIVGLAILGKLTPEAVDALKWIGGTFMAVRVVANHSENKYGSDSK